MNGGHERGITKYMRVCQITSPTVQLQSAKLTIRGHPIEVSFDVA